MTFVTTTLQASPQTPRSFHATRPTSGQSSSETKAEPPDSTQSTKTTASSPITEPCARQTTHRLQRLAHYQPGSAHPLACLRRKSLNLPHTRNRPTTTARLPWLPRIRVQLASQASNHRTRLYHGHGGTVERSINPLAALFCARGAASWFDLQPSGCTQSRF